MTETTTARRRGPAGRTGDGTIAGEAAAALVRGLVDPAAAAGPVRDGRGGPERRIWFARPWEDAAPLRLGSGRVLASIGAHAHVLAARVHPSRTERVPALADLRRRIAPFAAFAVVPRLVRSDLGAYWSDRTVRAHAVEVGGARCLDSGGTYFGARDLVAVSLFPGGGAVQATMHECWHALDRRCLTADERRMVAECAERALREPGARSGASPLALVLDRHLAVEWQALAFETWGTARILGMRPSLGLPRPLEDLFEAAWEGEVAARMRPAADARRTAA